MTRHKLPILLALLAPLGAAAQDSIATPQHIMTSSTMIGVGGTHILDTYLSQEKFSGGGVSFLARNEKERTGKRWRLFSLQTAHIAITEDRGKSGDELAMSYHINMGKIRWWNMGKSVKAGVGLSGAGMIGFLYNTSNSNNPAQARLAAHADISGLIKWRFSLSHRHMTLCYEISTPTVGLMFSPNYGQSYYEIFSRGDYDRNIRLTTPWNAPSLRQTITVDIPLKTHSLSIGYLGDIEQSRVNNLKTHYYNHRFMIGINRRFSVIRR